jgi:hypothetical protein
LEDASSLQNRGVILTSFAELLIDCEEDRVLRAVLVGMRWEGDRNTWGVTWPTTVTPVTLHERT